jgi:hypothetical protein
MIRPSCRILHLFFPVLIAVAGCVDQRTGDAPRPTPSSATPGLIALTVADLSDTDNNGYRDTTTAAVYLHAQGYPIPMKATGRFEFRLEALDGATLARWNFDEAQTAAALYDLAPGPGFIFDLSLLRLGSDKLDAREGVLVCTFHPVRGEPLRSRPSGTIILGPTTARGASK